MFWQLEGVHHTEEEYSSIPVALGTLAAAGTKDGELRHFDAQQVFLEASVDEETYICGSREISGVSEGCGVVEQYLRVRIGGKVIVQHVM